MQNQDEKEIKENKHESGLVETNPESGGLPSMADLVQKYKDLYKKLYPHLDITFWPDSIYLATYNRVKEMEEELNNSGEEI